MGRGGSDQLVDEVKRRTSIVKVIGEFVALRKAGRSHMGLCPFHGEKSASFSVAEAEGLYYCFGCQAKGDAISFLREHLGLSFREALEQLAEQAGVTLPAPEHHGGGDSSQGRSQRGGKETRLRFLALNGEALNYYRAALAGSGDRPGSQEALEYLFEKRQLSIETLDRFQVGWAPDAWDGLASSVLKSFDSQRDALALGLVIQKKDGSRGGYDRFRGRVMFPVLTVAGQVAGFSGRTLSADPETPKYLNSPESDVFQKGELLFGLFQARKAIREKSRAILVEGNVDVLSLSQAGFGEALAPMGTALTDMQAQLLARFTDSVILAYDGDRAGQAATLKSIPTLMKAGLGGRVVTLSGGDDPDTFVQREGQAAFEALIATARPFFGVALDAALATYDGTVPAKADVIQAVGPLFHLLRTREERDLYRERLSRALSVLVSDLDRWLAAATALPKADRGARSGAESDESTAGAEVARVAAARTIPAPKLEAQLMGLVLRHADSLLPFWVAREGSDLLTHQGVRTVLELAGQLLELHGNFSVAALFDALGERGLPSAQAAVARAVNDVDPYAEDAERAFVETCEELERKAQARANERERAEFMRLPMEAQIAALRSGSLTGTSNSAHTHAPDGRA